MSKKFILLAFLNSSVFLMSPKALSDSAIYNICPNSRKLNIVSTPEDLVSSVCQLQQKYSQDPKVKELTFSIVETLKNMTENEDSKEHKIKLSADLTSMSSHLESLNNIAIEKNNYKSKLQLALNNLNEKWSDKSRRKNPKKFNEYLSDIKNIISSTKTGKSVLECLNKAHGPNVLDKVIIKELSDEEKENGVKMEFDLEQDHENPSMFVKTISFNSDVKPFDAILQLAHEMQHGCDANSKAEVIQQLYSSTEGSKEREEALEKQDQDNAIDEMRAYKVTSEIFKDIAKETPSLVCHNQSDSILFGKQVLSTSEYSAKIDDMYENGTYPQYLISFYANHSALNPKYVLETDQNGVITNKLKSDLIEKIRKEGFFVK